MALKSDGTKHSKVWMQNKANFFNKLERNLLQNYLIECCIKTCCITDEWK